MEALEHESRVYITNFAGHDFTEAKKYGTLTPITKGYVSFGSLDRVKYLVCEGIKDSHKDDWLLLSGIPVLCVLAAIAWYHKHGRIKLLVHDKKLPGHYRDLYVSEPNLTDIFAELYEPQHTKEARRA